MNRWLVIPSVVIGLLLGGCTLAPDYARPPAPIPEQWPGAYQDAPTAAPAQPTPQLKWQDFFAEARLKKIIEMALINNRDLRLAALKVEKVRGMYGIQRAELFPAVNASASGGKQRDAEDLVQPGYPRTAEQYSLGMSVASWEIDFFGRLRSLEEQALQEYLATDQARVAAQISLVSEVALTYLTLAADRENVKLAQAALEAQQASYALVAKRHQVGLATELDLRRAQTPLETARVDKARYGQLAAQDLNALNLLAGSRVPEDLLPADLSSLNLPGEIHPGLSSEVLLRRPDVLAAEHRLKGAYAFVGAARAAFFPRISLTTSVGTASKELSGLFGNVSDTWSFVPQIVMPIFDARVWAALRVSQAEQQIVLTQYDKAIQVAFREVADALAAQGAADQQVAAQTALVQAVAETHRLSTARFARGSDSYLGVLDAQRSLVAAQQGLVALSLTRHANQVKLYAVLGGGGE